MNNPWTCNCESCRGTRIAIGIVFSLIAMLVLIVLSSGCASVHVDYHSVQFESGTTNVIARVDGSIVRRGLLVRTEFPPFTIGPSNSSVISTTGTLSTQGDDDMLRAVIDQAIRSGVQAAKP